MSDDKPAEKGAKDTSSGLGAGSLAAGLFWACAVVALYRGLSLPNRFVATQYTVSVVDGFWHRSLLGTLLRPIFLQLGYRYAVIACVGLAILAGVVLVLWALYRRSRTVAGQLTLLLFLLGPTGAFLCHEVGYQEQINYLMLAWAAWQLRRSALVASAAIMVLGMWVHPNALLSVIPLWLHLVWQARPTAWRIIAVVTLLVCVAVLLGVPPAAKASIAAHAAVLTRLADFAHYPDGLALFGRSLRDNWSLYNPWVTAAVVAPWVLLHLLLYLVLSAMRGPHRWRPGQDSVPGWLRGFVVTEFTAMAVIAAPFLLSFGGWDPQRWVFLSAVNLTIVVWQRLQAGDDEDSPRARPLPSLALGVLLALLLTGLPLDFFDGRQPRKLTKLPEVVQTLRQGDWLAPPKP